LDFQNLFFFSTRVTLAQQIGMQSHSKALFAPNKRKK